MHVIDVILKHLPNEITKKILKKKRKIVVRAVAALFPLQIKMYEEIRSDTENRNLS